MELREKIKEYHRELWHKHKQYVPTCGNSCGMDKIWNRGMGRLELWDINIEGKEVILNTCLANAHDKKYLKTLMNDLKLTDYKVYGVSFGYPTYYNNAFSKSLGAELLTL